MTPPDEPPEPDTVGRVTPASRGNWAPKRTELHVWLGSEAPLAADIYAAAIAILDDGGIPARHYLLWHAVREIRAHLPHAINKGKTKRYDPGEHIRSVAAQWREAGLPLATPAPALDQADPDPSGELATITIPKAANDAVIEMISAHENVGTRFRAANQQALTTIFGRPVPDYVARAWTNAFEDAADRAHLGNETPEVDLNAQAIDGFERFEEILMTITNKQFENQDLLDQILAAANDT